MTDLFVLRPWAAIFLIPALVFCFFRLRPVQNWLGIVDAHLIDRLVIKSFFRIKEKTGAVFLISCVFSFMAALCGVSLKNGDVPLYHPKAPAVIVLDMSLSMKVRDVEPNRFSRSVFKIYDLLNELQGTPVSLIVFTDEPYLLVPSTTDTKVVENVLPLLSFNLMPSQGSRIDRALEEALRTVKSTGASFGDIFLITDGAEEVLEIQDKTLDLMKTAFSEGTRLFVFGAGTPQGGPLFAKDDIPVSDALGNPVTHRLKEGYLKMLASESGGFYVRMRTDDSDVATIMKKRQAFFETGDKSGLTDDSVNDNGYLFLILPLAGFPFLFKKGRFLIISFFLSYPFSVKADMVSLFLSPSAAAMRFLNGGVQVKAVETAVQSNDFTALYNVGTRLILLQNYPQAVELLEAAVKIRPDDQNAMINLEIARRLNEQPSVPPPPEQENGQNGTENSPPDRDDNQRNDEKGDSDGDSGMSETSGNEGEQGKNNQNEDGDEGNDDSLPDSGGNEQGNGDSDSSPDDGNGEGTPSPDSGGNEQEDGNSDSSPDDGNGEGTPSPDSDGNEQEDGDSDPSPDDGNGEGAPSPDSGGNEQGDASGDGKTDEGNNFPSEQKRNGGIVPVHEDPSTLLKHKILFLYREKRYNDEKYSGAQW